MKKIKQFLEIAELTKIQGLKGEIRAKYYCDNPTDIGEFERLYFEGGENFLMPEYARPNKNIVIIKFKGIDTPEQASELLGKMLYIDRDDVELPDDTWFIQDLIGLVVRNVDSGYEYGCVKEILQTAPTDVYVISTSDGKELLFPSIPDVVKEVSPEKGIILIRPLDGLFDVGVENED